VVGAPADHDTLGECAPRTAEIKTNKLLGICPLFSGLVGAGAEAQRGFCLLLNGFWILVGLVGILWAGNIL